MIIFFEKIDLIIIPFFIKKIFFNKTKINLIVYYETNIYILKFIKFFLKILKINLLKIDMIEERNIISDKQNESVNSEFISKDLNRIKNFFLNNKKYILNILDNKKGINTDYFLKKIIFSDQIPNSLSLKIILFKILENNFLNDSRNIIFYLRPYVWNDIFTGIYINNKIKIIEINSYILNFLNFIKFQFKFCNLKLKIFIKHFVSLFLNFNTNQKYDKNKLYKLSSQAVGNFNLEKNFNDSDLFFLIYSNLSSKFVTNEYDNLNEKNLLFDHKITPITSINKFHKIYNFELNINIIKDKLNIHEINFLKLSNLEYNISYSYWYNYFTKNNIKVYFMWNRYSPEHIVIADVLNDLDGVLIFWNRSYEGLATVDNMTKCHVCFKYGFFKIENEIYNNNKINNLIQVGFLRDYHIKYTLMEANKIKDQLYKAGAKKIITLFDQNTSCNLQNDTYQNILNFLIDNQDLGLVIKPKKSKTYDKLFNSVTKNLFLKALKTKRFHIIDSFGKHQSNVPATLGAQCADLCIHAHLFPGSAGVESALTGTKTILIDREGFRSSNFHILRKNKVIFYNFLDALNASKKFLFETKEDSEFGNWDLIINQIDPYRDNQGVNRMGSYLQNLLTSINEGKDSKNSINFSNEKFIKEWGKDKILTK